MTVEDDVEDDASATTLKWLLGVAVLAVVVMGGVMVTRFVPWNGKPRAATIPSAASADSTVAPVESSPAPAVTHATPAATHAPTQAEVPQKPEPISKAPVEAAPRGPRPVATATHAAPKSHVAAAGPVPVPRHLATDSTSKPSASLTWVYSVAVATFLDQARAEVERSRLEASTKMSGRVQSVVADSVSKFELVLGSFPSQDAAERAASDLIARGLVDEARVVAQPRTPAPPPTPAATPH